MSKFCHNSDLKITKCMGGFPPVENEMLKTLWKVWKSTPETGVIAGLLNVLHRVFNLWKKQGHSTACIQAFLWKTSSPGKGADILPGDGQHFSTPGGTNEGRREILWKKKPQFYGKERPLMLYFKMNQ